MEHSKYRWRICALLFFATTINYLDRQVLGLLKPALAVQFNWTETSIQLHRRCVHSLLRNRDAALRQTRRQGRCEDRLRLCVPAVEHRSLRACTRAQHVRLWCDARTAGTSESGSFPCAVKSVSEWFPATSRRARPSVF